jgi:ligand-binding sensor domain-containing protein
MTRTRRPRPAHPATKLGLGYAIGLLFVIAPPCPVKALVESDLARCRSEALGPAVGLPSAEVQALLAAANGDVWIATSAGLARWSAGRITAHPHPPTFERTRLVLSMAIDAAGTLWMAPERGQPLCLRAGTTFEDCLRPEDSIKDDWPIVDMTSDRQGAVWFATADSVFRYANNQLSWISSYPREEAGAIRSLQPDGERLWIGAERGLFVRSASGEVKNHPIAGVATGAPVLTLSAARDGALLVGGAGVLARIGKNGTRVVRESDGLPASRFTSVIEDRLGNVWAASNSGLIRWSPAQEKSFDHHTRANSPLLEDDLTALLEDQSGALWLGTRRFGIQRLTDPPEQIVPKIWPYALAAVALGVVVFFLLRGRKRAA